VRLGEGLVKRVWPRPGRPAEEHSGEAQALHALAWGAYALGAACGALGVELIGTPLLLLVPAALTLAAAIELAMMPD
jgi:uncharacterized membrane protein YoaK (UPF0700 family)